MKTLLTLAFLIVGLALAPAADAGDRGSDRRERQSTVDSAREYHHHRNTIREHRRDSQIDDYKKPKKIDETESVEHAEEAAEVDEGDIDVDVERPVDEADESIAQSQPSDD